MIDLIEDNDFLLKVFNSASQAMVLFDSSANIIFKNEAADSLVGNTIFSSSKDSIKEIIKSDAPYKKRINYKYMDEDREKEMSVLINGSVIEYAGEKYALLIIQDTAEIMRTDGVVKICSNCKKIKRSESSWQEIEAYIKDNLANIHFSHSICPGCSKKLYKTK